MDAEVIRCKCLRKSAWNIIVPARVCSSNNYVGVSPLVVYFRVFYSDSCKLFSPLLCPSIVFGSNESATQDNVIRDVFPVCFEGPIATTCGDSSFHVSHYYSKFRQAWEPLGEAFNLWFAPPA